MLIRYIVGMYMYSAGVGFVIRSLFFVFALCLRVCLLPLDAATRVPPARSTVTPRPPVLRVLKHPFQDPAIVLAAFDALSDADIADHAKVGDDERSGFFFLSFCCYHTTFVGNGVLSTCATCMPRKAGNAQRTGGVYACGCVFV